MNYERALIPHLCNPDAIDYIEQNLDVTWIDHSELREMVEVALTYYRSSDKTQAIPREVLEAEFGRYFANEGWPNDEPVSIPFVVDRLRQENVRRRVADIIDENRQALADPDDLSLAGVVQKLQDVIRTHSDNKTRPRGYTLSDLEDLPDDPDWTIEGLLYIGGVALLAGPPRRAKPPSSAQGSAR